MDEVCGSRLPAGVAAPRRRRILLVEDEPALRRALARNLRHAGYEVTSAASVAEGWRQSLGQDIALLDIELGDGSGVDLGRDLLSWARVSRLVFYTGCVHGGTLARAAQLGTVVLKRSGIQELLSTLDQRG